MLSQFLTMLFLDLILRIEVGPQFVGGYREGQRVFVCQILVLKNLFGFYIFTCDPAN